MPTYEYRCVNSHSFQRFYKTMSTAAAELPCPECSATASRQLSGGAGLLFKGSGFYLTDYGKNAHRKGATDAASGKGDAKADAGKSDSAPKADGAKAEPKPASTTPASTPSPSPSSKPKSE